MLTNRRFYNGGEREKGILWSAYQRLAKHVHSVFQVRIPYGYASAPRDIAPQLMFEQDDRGFRHQIPLVRSRLRPNVHTHSFPGSSSHAQSRSWRRGVQSGRNAHGRYVDSCHSFAPLKHLRLRLKPPTAAVTGRGRRATHVLRKGSGRALGLHQPGVRATFVSTRAGQCHLSRKPATGNVARR